MSHDTGYNHTYTGLEIAVIGMAGRFPLAENTGQFWQNLVQGLDGISRFAEEELRDLGVPEALLNDEHFVSAKGVFPHLDSFDASFFGYTPADACIMDPQVRALHEEVFHALEDAGYSAEDRPESIGVFLGATNNLPWEAHTLGRYLKEGPAFVGMQLNDKDFAATRIAYALNLRGPALTLHTACSTSLVAIDIACRHILTGACQMAVAGGSSLTLPQKNGYLYQEGMIYSPDGACRAFDARAEGTVEGNGVGIVVLKRLEVAQRDGDRVLAVIRASATNNDGNRKIGYTAPSVEGQADVIRKAQRLARVKPHQISYVETHGTGTRLGDVIEIEALSRAFADEAIDPNSCGIGSLKASIGHLDTAAGVASFIKCVQILQHTTVPASLHYTEPNPNISFEGSPFYVVAAPQAMERRSKGARIEPLRVGVSSFGIGGTNAHIVLEEAPLTVPAVTTPRPHNTAVLSAHSPEALQASKKQLAEYLATHPDLAPADVAWTLQNRVRRLRYRYAVDFSDVMDLSTKLQFSADQAAAAPEAGTVERPDVCCLFSGLGAQHVGMARGLYETEPSFRARLDNGFELAAEVGRGDLRDLFLGDGPEVEAQLNDIETTQVLLFILEVSMANQLIEWGLHPTSLIGHSTGEFAAACVAGVFTFAEGIRLIQARGHLMGQTGPGGMLTVTASEEVARGMLGDRLTLAAVNSPEDCSVSGPTDELNAFEQRCREAGINVKRLAAEHAYHSADMEEVLPRFAQILRGVDLKAPQIRYVSNVTGTWITASEATDPDYWCRHLRSCVRFKEGIETIWRETEPVFVEVGPGRGLSSFARHCTPDRTATAVNTLRHRMETISDDAHWAKAAGKLWEAGMSLDWAAFQSERGCRRVELPLYPFDRTPYPIDIEEFQRHYSTKEAPSPRRRELVPVEHDALVGPRHVVWTNSVVSTSAEREAGRTVIAIARDVGGISRLLQGMPNWRSLFVKLGNRYEFREQDGATVRRDHTEDFTRLVADLKASTLLGDTFLLHRDTDDHVQPVLRALAAALTEVTFASPPAIVMLDEASPHLRGERVNLLVGLSLEFPDVALSSLECDEPLASHAGQKMWQTALLDERGVTGVRDIAVRYEAGQRLIPTLHALSTQAGPISGVADRTLLWCSQADLPTVLTMLDHHQVVGSLTIQPYHIGEEEPAPALMSKQAARPGTTLLPTITAMTVEAFVSQIEVRAGSLPLVDRVVVWDPMAGAADSAMRARIHAAFGRLRPGTTGAVDFLSPTELFRLDQWSSTETQWMVDTARLDAAATGSRLWVHVPLEQTEESCLAVLQLMRRFGVGAAHLGADPFRLAGSVGIRERVETSPADDSALEQIIAAKLAHLLGYDTVALDADVFDLGLDSVRLVQFVSELAQLGHEALMPDVYGHPTVRSLAAFLSERRRADNDQVTLGSFTAGLSEAVGHECIASSIQGEDGTESLLLLFVEGLDAEVRSRVVKALHDLDIPPSLHPHYILSKDHETQLQERPDFDTLRAVLSSTHLRTVDELVKLVEQGQEGLLRDLSAPSVVATFPISATQKTHFRGEVRLQLYLVQFHEVIDVGVLERAMCDVIGRHGLLRSFLTRRFGRMQWQEFDAPLKVTLPQVDLSSMEPSQQQELVSGLIRYEWSLDFKTIDRPMFQMVLLKYNDKRYDFLFQFDHSIFDLSSGQVMRRDLLTRYRDLLAGTVMAMPRARSFRDLQAQVDKGPVGITPEQIIEKFDLKRYVEYTKLTRQRTAHHAKRPVRQARYAVDLAQIQQTLPEGLELFSLVAYLYGRLVDRLVGIDHVACDILFKSRTLEGQHFTDIMGMVLGGVPIVLPTDRSKRSELQDILTEKFSLLNHHNISFLNLIHDIPSALRYRKVYELTKEVNGPTFHTTCLLNFVGAVEEEYDAIWDMTMEQLDDEDQEKLDYADIYTIAKVNGARLDLLVLTRWAEPHEVTALLDDEVARLVGPVPNLPDHRKE